MWKSTSQIWMSQYKKVGDYMSKYFTDEQYRRISMETDLLRGNINRMCVADDEKECAMMHYYAIERVNIIFKTAMTRFEEGEENE